VSRTPAAVIVLALAAALATGARAQGTADPPAWAYPVNPAGMKPPARPLDLFAAPDWRPADHAPMPAIVARGMRRLVEAVSPR
jgi:hypothetical protein